MVDRTGDWCFEGGCTFLSNDDNAVYGEADFEELEALYLQPCSGSYD